MVNDERVCATVRRYFIAVPSALTHTHTHVASSPCHWSTINCWKCVYAISRYFFDIIYDNNFEHFLHLPRTALLITHVGCGIAMASMKLHVFGGFGVRTCTMYVQRRARRRWSRRLAMHILPFSRGFEHPKRPPACFIEAHKINITLLLFQSKHIKFSAAASAPPEHPNQ